ncbi:hypothetical protein J4219_06385 [Candidatus Woesearchaeota archaeon]|nr:hypothetical protein [Candidatus Woesearchaeota archaeon]
MKQEYVGIILHLPGEERKLPFNQGLAELDIGDALRIADKIHCINGGGYANTPQGCYLSINATMDLIEYKHIRGIKRNHETMPAEPTVHDLEELLKPPAQ